MPTFVNNKKLLENKKTLKNMKNVNKIFFNVKKNVFTSMTRIARLVVDV